MAEHMLTTEDNPYNPFTNYDEWFEFDRIHGYHTPSLLARVVRSSDNLSEADQSEAIEIAIDEIVEQNVTGIHKKISKEIFSDGGEGSQV